MYRIDGLEPAPFERMFEMTDDALARLAARRVIVDGPGFPCRVSLVDADAGETVVLCHHAHHDVASPYRAAGPIFVRRGVARARFVDAVPPALASRLLSVRAYRADGEMARAEVVPGAELAPLIERWFAEPDVAYLHAHNAPPGCFAARIDRA